LEDGERGAKVKRFAIAVASVAVFVLLGGTALADGNGATIETFPVSFVIDSANCSYLPAGTTITGSGTEKSITVVKTNANGITLFHNTSHATGTATDQDGNTYVFDYNNEFSVSNTAANPGLFTGSMEDHFSLAGKGPAKLSNGFHAAVTTDLGALFELTPLQSRGDPIDFTTLAAHCDPL
jgi:hypothetical protein